MVDERFESTMKAIYLKNTPVEIIELKWRDLGKAWAIFGREVIFMSKQAATLSSIPLSRTKGVDILLRRLYGLQ